MMTIDMVLLEFRGLRPDDLQAWIAAAWIRPEGAAGHYRFHDIDVARIRLILDLRETMEVPDLALPTVLSLLDQVYEMRRHVHRMNQALASLPEDVRASLRDRLK